METNKPAWQSLLLSCLLCFHAHGATAQPATAIATIIAKGQYTRRNDINEQMRNVARGTTPEEIDRAALFFANHYPNPP